MSSSHLSSQDIQPEESVSQIDYMSSAASSSRSTFKLTNDPLAVFRSYFKSSSDLGDKYLVVENDPVTLARAKGILKVFT
jgi:hypothetical protein